MTMTLGQRITELRTSLGLSQEAFGERLGTTRQTVSRWELDQSLPELAKIVRMSRIFSVTTDSLLREGISTFEDAADDFSCGIYRGSTREAAESERFALVLYHEGGILGAALYAGFAERKRLAAICEHDAAAKVTRYAYRTDAGESIGDTRLAVRLGERFDAATLRRMRRLETFAVDRSGEPMPTVREAGIPRCLAAWRLGSSYRADAGELYFYLCTGRTEYIFSVQPQADNIYCGASYNQVFDLGLFGGRQFFRIRHLGDDSAPFCGFHSDFTCEAPPADVPMGECEIGRCVQTSRGLAWCVKRYGDDEIVLAGCGEDEYTYRRDEARTERFRPE